MPTITLPEGALPVHALSLRSRTLEPNKPVTVTADELAAIKVEVGTLVVRAGREPTLVSTNVPAYRKVAGDKPVLDLLKIQEK